MTREEQEKVFADAEASLKLEGLSPSTLYYTPKVKMLDGKLGAPRRALTDAGAEGITATDASALCFEQVPLQQSEVPPQQSGRAAFPLAV